MTPVLVLCILLCAASAAPAEKENLPKDVSEPQEEIMRMMLKEEAKELPEDPLPELIDARFSSCPIGWYQYSGFCYKVFTTSKTWFDASEDCHSWGAQLASVSTASLYEVLQQLSGSTNVQYAWIGGVYLQSKWMWTDGQRFSYDGWDTQNTASSYPCIYLRSTTGWRNAACSSTTHNYICAKRAGC